MLLETNADPISTVFQRVFKNTQRLFRLRPGLERRYEQDHSTVSVEVVGHNGAGVLFQRHTHQMARLDK